VTGGITQEVTTAIGIGRGVRTAEEGKVGELSSQEQKTTLVYVRGGIKGQEAGKVLKRRVSSRGVRENSRERKSQLGRSQHHPP